MDNVVCRLNVDAEPNGDRRKNDDAKSRLRLECLDPLLTAGDMLCRRRVSPLMMSGANPNTSST